MQLNLFKAGLKIEFEPCTLEDSCFLEEYLSLSANSGLQKWKKLASKLDLDNEQKLIFDLLLSVKEDLGKIQNFIFKDESLLSLSKKAFVESLNFEYINLTQPFLEQDKQYYARFELNKQKIPVFLQAQSENLAKIIKIKSEDQMIYNAFVVDIQRDIIKNMKGE